MKRHIFLFILIWLCLVTTAKSFGQGYINFLNRILGEGIDAPVFYIDGVTPLAGDGFLAQLYAGPQGSSESGLVPVGSAATFRSGAGAGYWKNVPSAVISFARPGEIATVQVRVWEAAAGSYEAATAGKGFYGMSDLLDIETYIPDIGYPNGLRGLQSFSLVPEPTALGLSILGAMILFLNQMRQRGRGNNARAQNL